MKIKHLLDKITIVVLVIYMTLVYFVGLSFAEDHKVVGIHTYKFCKIKCSRKYNCIDFYNIDEDCCNENYECSKCLDKCDEELQEYRDNYNLKNKNNSKKEVD